MRKPILIVQNIPHERAGLIETVLVENNWPFKTLEMADSTMLPDLNDFAALIVMGGPHSANDTTPHMTKVRDLTKTALDKKLPYLGVCLGMQVLAKVAGGTVKRAPIPEIGFRGPNQETFLITLTEEGRKDDLFRNLDTQLPVFQLHKQTVTTHPSICLLATGEFVKFQAIKVGENAYGLQCHFELTEKMFLEWLREDPDLQKAPLPLLLEDYERLKAIYEKTGRQITENFLSIVKQT